MWCRCPCYQNFLQHWQMWNKPGNFDKMDILFYHLFVVEQVMHACPLSRRPTVVNWLEMIKYLCPSCWNNELKAKLIMISGSFKESILKSVFIKVTFGAINNVDSIRADNPFIFMIKMKIWREKFLGKEFLSKDKMSDNDFLQLHFNKRMSYSIKNKVKSSSGSVDVSRRCQQSSFRDKTTTQILLCK